MVRTRFSSFPFGKSAPVSHAMCDRLDQCRFSRPYGMVRKIDAVARIGGGGSTASLVMPIFIGFPASARCPRWCVAVTVWLRIVSEMNTRFEIRIPAEQRARLDALAADAGLSSSDLARLAIGQILEDRAVRLPKVDAAQDNRRHSLTEASS
jgi:hypothetical protein